MTKSIDEPSARPDQDTAPVVQAVTILMGSVIGLTFLCRRPRRSRRHDRGTREGTSCA
jgi:hypothetical protein